MDGRPAGGAHIPIARLVEFILRQTSLTQEESAHLARCPTCMRDMAEGAHKEIEKSSFSPA
jgi:hypothetical protein